MIRLASISARPIIERDFPKVLAGHLECVQQTAGAPGAHGVGRDPLENLVDHGEDAGWVGKHGKVDRFIFGAKAATGHDAGARVEVAEGRSTHGG